MKIHRILIDDELNQWCIDGDCPHNDIEVTDDEGAEIRQTLEPFRNKRTGGPLFHQLLDDIVKKRVIQDDKPTGNPFLADATQYGDSQDQVRNSVLAKYTKTSILHAVLMHHARSGSIEHAAAADILQGKLPKDYALLAKASNILAQMISGNIDGVVDPNIVEIVDVPVDILESCLRSKATIGTEFIASTKLFEYLHQHKSASCIMVREGPRDVLRFIHGNVSIQFELDGTLASKREEVDNFFAAWEMLSGAVRRQVVWVESQQVEFAHLLMVVYNITETKNQIGMVPNPDLGPSIVLTGVAKPFQATMAKWDDTIARIVKLANVTYSQMKNKGHKKLALYTAVLRGVAVAAEDSGVRDLMEVAMMNKQLQAKYQECSKALEVLENMAFTPDIELSLAKDATSARAVGMKRRNVGPREIIAKTLGAPKNLHNLPNSFSVANKFRAMDDLVAKDNDHGFFEEDCRVYGTAGLAMYGVMTTKGTKKPGKREWYDIRPTTTYTSAQVMPADILLPLPAGGEWWIIDDTDATQPAEPATRSDSYLYGWSVGGTAVKLRRICDAAPVGFVSKQYLDDKFEKDRSQALALIVASYKHIRFVKPGKLQSNEFFIIAWGRHGKNPIPVDAVEEIEGRFRAFSNAARAVITLANRWMTECTFLGQRRPMPDKWYKKLKIPIPVGPWNHDRLLVIHTDLTTGLVPEAIAENDEYF